MQPHIAEELLKEDTRLLLICPPGIPARSVLSEDKYGALSHRVL